MTATCSSCSTLVVPNATGRCPSCREPFVSAHAAIPSQDTVAPTPTTVEVRFPDARTRSYAGGDQLTDLAVMILDGKLPRTTPARVVAPRPLDAETTEPTWTTLEEAAQADFSLRVLYQPIAACAFRGAAIGVGVGIVLKLFDTTVAMFAADERLGLVWLATLGALLVMQWFWFAPLLVYFLMLRAGVVINPAGFCGAVFGSMLAGSAFGAPAGAVVGAVTGAIKALTGRLAPDAQPCWVKHLALGLVLPAALLAALVWAYAVWFMPWVIEKLGQ